VGVLIFYGLQLNPSEAQAKDLPAKGDAKAGLAALDRAGISPGAIKPFDILVEGPVSTQKLHSVAAAVAGAPGVAGAAAPFAWRTGTAAIVEAFPAEDGAAKSVRGTISNLQHNVLPDLSSTFGDGTRLTLGGVAPEDRDFVHAVYNNFPYVLAFVILLTYILLARAFRSLILPLKAVILNLVSLGAAYGIIVFIFQQGHGSEAIWNVHATQSIIPWIPLMIFAFLFGLSMDYEVFMLTRMREAYDETGDTKSAVALGLARTGKLVTSAALILMFAFFVLSSSPGVDIKQFGIGLAAGIIFDATVIRALLVPALMRLLGRWNWWLPKRAARVLFVRDRPQLASDSA
jgi:RND superfamily putative drug exporter